MRAVGEPEIQLEVDGGATTADVVLALQTQYPQLERLLPRCALAVNGDYVQGDTPLSEGDEVAVLPPMSGG